MILGLAVLLACQLLGEVVVALLELPIPGPVAGMVLLLGALLLRRTLLLRRQRPPLPPGYLATTARGLLNHLALFFVPAGSGVAAYGTLLRQEWLPLTTALIGGTLLTMAVTALTMQWVGRGMRHQEKA